MKDTILVTGAAGFIGSFLCKRLLLDSNVRVIGFDNCNDYYDPKLKLDRLAMVEGSSGSDRFLFVKGDLADEGCVNEVFERYRPNTVVNLGAQAGVRYSIENPRAYIDSNIIGFFNILEAVRIYGADHLVYASSSSVYGGNKKIPFSEEDRVDSPVSLYAASKKSNELMAYAYSKLYDIPATGLRFFTVYGPMGRPDMAYFSFTDKLVRGERINLFNMGNCKRDFTFVDDVVSGIIEVMHNAPKRHTGEDGLPDAPHRVYNIGNSNPESLFVFVKTLHRVLVEEGVLSEDFRIEDHINLLPMQPGDVAATYANVSLLQRDTGFKPSTSLEEGLRTFARWYKSYYRQ